MLQIRRAFRNIRRTVPDIIHVLILFFLCVLLFGLMGLKLFYKRSATWKRFLVDKKEKKQMCMSFSNNIA